MMQTPKIVKYLGLLLLLSLATACGGGGGAAPGATDTTCVLGSATLDSCTLG